MSEITFEGTLNKTLAEIRDLDLPDIPKGDFGIEIELEGLGLFEVREKIWKSKKEGSLRNGGMEYVTISPIPLEAVEFEVQRLSDKLRNMGAAINLDAYRTSTHIHVNYTKETARTIVASIILWALVEPVVLRMCGIKRDGNPFCLPTSISYGHGQFIFDFLKVAVDSGLFRLPKYGARYSALNTQALTTFGSLEYRCFPASLNPKEILGWCKMLESLRSAARETTDAGLQTLILEVYRNPELVGRLLKSREFETLLGPTSLQELVSIGCQTAYELSRDVQRFRNTFEVLAQDVRNYRKRIDEITHQDYFPQGPQGPQGHQEFQEFQEFQELQEPEHEEEPMWDDE